MNLNEIITYAPNVTVCITANEVVGTIKIMDVDASGANTGLVLAVLPEGAVSQTAVTLQSGSIKAVAESGATVGSLQVLRPVAPFKTAAALASQGGGLPIMDGRPFAYTNQYGDLQPIKAYDAFYGGEIIEEFSNGKNALTTNLTAGKYKLVIESFTSNECGSGTTWIQMPGQAFQVPLPSNFNVTELSLCYVGAYSKSYVGSLLVTDGAQQLKCEPWYNGTGDYPPSSIDYIKGECVFTLTNTQPLIGLIDKLATIERPSGEQNTIGNGYNYFISHKLIKL